MPYDEPEKSFCNCWIRWLNCLTIFGVISSTTNPELADQLNIARLLVN
jgi:hypothetical protein